MKSDTVATSYLQPGKVCLSRDAGERVPLALDRAARVLRRLARAGRSMVKHGQ